MHKRDEKLLFEKRFYPDGKKLESYLRSIYKDKELVIEGETAREISYRIIDPLNEEYYRDPNLVENLYQTFGLTIEDIPSYREIKWWKNKRISYLKSFNHTWALLAWSKWFKKNHSKGKVPLIIHLDSHNDLMSPSIVPSNSPHIYSSIDGEILDLRSPKTVAPFILRGMIGIGGFILPFLNAVGNCELIHISHQPDILEKIETKNLNLIPELFNHMWGSNERFRIQFTDRSEEICGSDIQYSVTSDINFIETIKHSGPVFLDIDMDFFCNRYDDSLRGSVKESPVNANKSPEDVCQTIDTLKHHLLSADIRKQIEVITIALSPGFYPSEFWYITVPYIESMLQSCINS